MTFDTKILTIHSVRQTEDLQAAANVLLQGGLVVLPTETVYGLGADALNPRAVQGIFEAKGRPMDNPLIVHLAEVAQVHQFARDIPESFFCLADAFCPGPLTMILHKQPIVPYETSGGLETVAIRFPSHPVARATIRLCQTGVAAPSANRSGSPSPTTAGHCIDDLMGRVDMIVDGGSCALGVESTVLSLTGDRPRLLRPGGVTKEMLEQVLGEVEVDEAVLHQLPEGEVAHSPGMKYKHYAPKAKVIMVEGTQQNYVHFVNSKKAEGVFALCFEEDIPHLQVPAVAMGKEQEALTQAQCLFDSLRELDKRDAKLAYARCPAQSGMGLAVYNRLLRAAAFEVITV